MLNLIDHSRIPHPVKSGLDRGQKFFGFIKIFIALSVAGVLISLLSIVLTNSKKIFRLYNAKNIEKITQTIKGTEKKVIKSKIAKDLISSIKKYPLRIAIIIMISIIILT